MKPDNEESLKSTDMAKFRVLTDSELYEGLIEERDDKVTQLHREIEKYELLICRNGDKLSEQDQTKAVLQAMNCSELKLSSLSINSSINKLIASRNG